MQAAETALEVQKIKQYFVLVLSYVGVVLRYHCS